MKNHVKFFLDHWADFLKIKAWEWRDNTAGRMFALYMANPFLDSSTPYVPWASQNDSWIENQE